MYGLGIAAATIVGQDLGAKKTKASNNWRTLCHHIRCLHMLCHFDYRGRPVIFSFNIIYGITTVSKPGMHRISAVNQHRTTISGLLGDPERSISGSRLYGTPHPGCGMLLRPLSTAVRLVIIHNCRTWLPQRLDNRTPKHCPCCTLPALGMAQRTMERATHLMSHGSIPDSATTNKVQMTPIL